MLPPDNAPTTDKSASNSAENCSLKGRSDPAMAHDHLHPVKAVTPSRADGSRGGSLIREARKGHSHNLTARGLGLVISCHAPLPLETPIIQWAMSWHPMPAV